MSQNKFDRKNSEWIQKFIFSIRRGGEQEIDEALIKSIFEKIEDYKLNRSKIYKLLRKLTRTSIKMADKTLAFLSNEKVIRFLSEYQKPLPSSMPQIVPSDILDLPTAEGFAPSTTSLSPYQQRVKTHVLAAQKNKDVFLVAQDGAIAILKDKSTNHLLSKHGDALGIDDPLPPNPNQKLTKYKQTRTRVNKENKKQFAGTLEKIIQNPKTEVFPDVSIRGIRGQVYYTKDYGGFIIGIHTEGEFAGQIMKAQPISDPQLKMLRKFNKID